MDSMILVYPHGAMKFEYEQNKKPVLPPVFN